MYRELGTQGALKMRKDPLEGFIRDCVRQKRVYCKCFRAVFTYSVKYDESPMLGLGSIWINPLSNCLSMRDRQSQDVFFRRGWFGC